jgi:5-methylcytosine-specific restriction protein A
VDLVKRWGYSIPDDVKPSGIPVVLVCGPPASGKTTLARGKAKHGDMIIDLDDYKVKAGGKKWDVTPGIWRKAYAMRDAAIRSLRALSSGTCYLIVTAPTKQERDAWREALGDVAVEIVDTPADTCIARIKGDPKRKDASDGQVKAVLNWWQYN